MFRYPSRILRGFPLDIEFKLRRIAADTEQVSTKAILLIILKFRCGLMNRIFLRLIVVLLIAGCAQTPKNTNVGAPDAEETQFTGEYHIGSGDMLKVFVWRNPELTVAIPVRPDGKISVPLIEDMEAAGKTPTQLARDVEEGFKRYIRDPVVTVIVTSFVGSYSGQIKVIGAAVKPTSLPYRAGMTLLDVIIAVGGLSEFADGNQAKVVRVMDGELTDLHVRVDDLVQRGDVGQNVSMRPGDVLIIPETWF